MLGMLVEGLTVVLTAANGLVEENPAVTAAIVGITTALAALAIGAVATSSVVTGTLIPALMAAFSNPVMLAVAAIGALVAALVTLRQNMQETSAEGQMLAATKQMREEAEALTETIHQEQQAFEELAGGLEKIARSGGPMVDELDELRKRQNLQPQSRSGCSTSWKS